MANRTKQINGIEYSLTAQEEAQRDAEETAWDNKSAERKLNNVKEIRLQKLKETDYMANSDYTMPDDVKTWRQAMRDIPANYTTETKYDELLARDADGNLTHSIWSK